MTRKKLFIILICSAMLLTLCIAGGYYAILFMKHPAFTHDDYVYGNKLVIDNETPFEYDAELATEHRLYTDYYRPIDTLELAQAEFGNKIMRERDGKLYTVYSDEDNHLYYLFFKKDENGAWTIYDSCSTSVAFMAEPLLEYIYEYDTPQAILGDIWPETTITPEESARRVQWANNALYTIRHNLDLVDIRDIVTDGTYAQAYRMTFEGIFHGVHYIDFYVHHDGTGTLIYKRYNSEESINAKEVFEDVRYSLSKEETTSLLGVWDAQDFFRSFPAVHDYEEVNYSIMDGYTTYLEGINYVTTFEDTDDISIYGDYHMSRVHDHSLNFTEFWAIRDAMVAMVESKGTEVRFNRTWEEEELRANQGN